MAGILFFLSLATLARVRNAPMGTFIIGVLDVLVGLSNIVFALTIFDSNSISIVSNSGPIAISEMRGLSLWGGLCFCAVGIYFIVISQRLISERRSIVRHASELLSAQGEIDIGQIAAELGITIGEVAEVIEQAQQKGRLPAQAKILR